MKTEPFICSQCGIKERLSSLDRHWCKECTSGRPVEMQPVRFRSFGFAARAREELAQSQDERTQSARG